MRRDLMRERDAHFVERGFVDARRCSPTRRCPEPRPSPREERGEGEEEPGRLAVGSSTTASSVARRRLSFVAQPRGFLEVEIGGGFAHAGFEVGEHRLEIVADGDGVVAPCRASPISTPARGRARRREFRMSPIDFLMLSGVMPWAVL